MKTIIAVMALALTATSVSAQEWTKADCVGLAFVTQEIAMMKLAGQGKYAQKEIVSQMGIDPQIGSEVRSMVRSTPMDQLEELPILVLNDCLDRIGYTE